MKEETEPAALPPVEIYTDERIDEFAKEEEALKDYKLSADGKSDDGFTRS